MLKLWPGKENIRTVLCLLLAYGLLFAIIAGRSSHRRAGSLFVSDGFGYYIYLPSLVLDRDLDLTNQLAYQAEQPDQAWYQYVETTGRPGNCFQVGCAVLWFPFFLVAHGIVLVLNALGMHVVPNGFGFAYEMPVYIGSFTYGLLGLRYLWLMLRDIWGESVAFAVAFYIAVATALAAYLWFEPDMSHVISTFLINALFYYSWRIYKLQSLDWRRWAGVGLILGLIAAVRVPDALTGILPGLTALLVCRQRKPHWGLVALCFSVFTASMILGFLPQMLVWKSLYGGYLTRPPGVYQTMNWSNPDLLGYFFSSNRGILVWTPLLLLGIIGLILGAVRGSLPIRLAFLVFALAVYFNASIPKWWVGCSFGERRLVDYSIVFALGLAYLFHQYPSLYTRVWSRGFLAALVVFNWILMARYFTHDLPEWGPVSWDALYVRSFLYPFRMMAKILGADYSIDGSEWHT